MGKRELILIAVFAVVGVAVYQLTAPPAAPGEQGFSISRIVNNLRREMQGSRANAEATNRAQMPVSADVTDLRVNLTRGPITIVGEDRAEIDGEVVARSTGQDETEAKLLAQQTVLTLERSGTTVLATVHFPVAGRQTARLTLKVPAHLRVRIDSSAGELQISGVQGVELGQPRGETTLRDIKGRVTGSQRGGELTIANAGALRLTARGTDVRLEQIRGEAVLNLQAGELKATGVAGPIEIESSASDITLDGFDKTTGSLRISATSGSVDIKGLRVESRIDLRNSELDLAVDRAAPISVYSEGDEPVTLTAPAGGFRLEAIARNARILGVPDDQLKRWGLEAVGTGEAGENRAEGDVNGGGALITIRTERGDITLRARDGA
jgi:hypothetical protein